MAPPTKGLWASRKLQPYATPTIWGTGINDVHQVYGSPPARQGDLRPREGEITPPYEAVPERILPQELWGYNMPTGGPTGVTYDDRPRWDSDPEDNPSRMSTGDQPPLNARGYVKAAFRAIKGGAHRYRQKLADALPSETVSEGWVNKPHGSPANAKPSDQSQYEIQTSMAQRYQRRNNAHSVARSTDAPRAGIASRVTGQHTPVYSTGERLYDMFPFQQDQIDRPFWYRSAGTGDPAAMAPNEMWSIDAIERTPPPDPYIGPMEANSDYGYTSEDAFYA